MCVRVVSLPATFPLLFAPSVQAQKVIIKSEKEARNEHTLQYNERNPFDIDCEAFLPIYRGSPVVKCAYCASTYAPTMMMKMCKTCEISLIGVETIGLVCKG